MSQKHATPLEYTSDALLSMDIPPMASERMHRLPPYLFGRINALRSSLRQKGIDIIDITAIRSTIHNNQRVVSCIE